MTSKEMTHDLKVNWYGKNQIKKERRWLPKIAIKQFKKNDQLMVNR